MLREGPDSGPVILPETGAVLEQMRSQLSTASNHLRLVHHEEGIVNQIEQEEKYHSDKSTAVFQKWKFQLLQIEGAQTELAREEIVIALYYHRSRMS